MSSEINQNKEKNLEEALTEVRKLVGDIKYGSVTLVVQDGVVVHSERVLLE